MRPPRIQISGSPEGLSNYCRAVRRAGGFPVPGYAPAPDPACAGLVLCGGGDLDPALFGQENRGSQPPDPARDKAELALFLAFFQWGRPILGICRGMQVINVALGGTLIQDLPAPLRPFHVGDGTDRIHPIRSAEGSLLRCLYGPVFPVNSWHHQAVDCLGSGLEACAWAEGGFPEAMAYPGRPILAVQFHPERLTGPPDRPDGVDGGAVFAWFVSLCSGHKPLPPGREQQDGLV